MNGTANIPPAPPMPPGVPPYEELYNTQMQQLNDAANIALSKNGMNSMNNSGSNWNKMNGSNSSNNVGNSNGSGSNGNLFSEPGGVIVNTNKAGVTSPLIREIQNNARQGILPTNAQASAAVAQQMAAMEAQIVNPNTPNDVKNAITTIIGHIDVMKDFGMSSLNDLAHLSNLTQQANNFLANGTSPEFTFPIYSDANVSATLTDLGNGTAANSNAAILAQNAKG
ncbi:hypothetical protein [Paraburkholderia humisilvae]|nr:hypothetical protein [Paraburkholderia humisilvae]